VSIGHRSAVPFAGSRRSAPRTLATGAVLVMASVALAPLPGAAVPDKPHQPLTIASAQHQIAVLNRQAEVAAEQMNTVRVRLGAAQQRLHTLHSQVERQQLVVSRLRTAVVGSAVTDYQSASGLSTAVSFFSASDPRQFLSDLATQAVSQNQEAGVLDQLRRHESRLTTKQQRASRELSAIAAARSQLARHQAQLDARTQAAHQVLDRLRARQRKLLAQRQARQEHRAQLQASRDAQRVAAAPAQTTPTQAPATAPAPAASVPASAGAQTAVGYALAQVGDPYVYGAAGPDAFDCSGLTMAAWAAAGVSIPHSASMQASAGTPVSISALQPGDLVFYYSPISHVGMYVGNGEVVHAPYPGSSVEVVPLDSMPIAMAVRIG
jgi:cell wall-associated NlpC family hydrolase